MSNKDLAVLAFKLGSYVSAADITCIVVIGSDDGSSQITISAVLALVNRGIEVNNRNTCIVSCLECRLCSCNVSRSSQKDINAVSKEVVDSFVDQSLISFT